jgi:hypothetical protein
MFSPNSLSVTTTQGAIDHPVNKQPEEGTGN